MFGVAIGFGGLWIWRLDQLSSQFLSSVQWVEPGRLYARPLTLAVGSQRTPEQVMAELEQLRYMKTEGVLRPGQVQLKGSSVSLYLQHAMRTGPVGSVVKVDFRSGRVVAISDAHGRAIDQLGFEPVALGTVEKGVDEDRVVIALADAPPLLVAALQAVEDRSFKHHSGVSVRGIARAAWRNLRAGGVVEGGSTLTQQLVKNLYVDPGRTWWRKANEAVLSLLIEARHDKAAIIEAYLNQVYLGQQRGRAIHGVALASQFYFGVPLEQLQPHQIALMIGMIRGPSWYNPWRNTERAMTRRNTVLNAMYDTGLISHSERLKWQARPLDVVRQPTMVSAGGRGIAELVQTQLGQMRLDGHRALRVETTLDPVLQNDVGRLASAAVDRLQRDHGLSGLDLAVVVVERETAQLRALIGGKSGVGFNRALNAHRPIGSLLKPFIYLTALQRGGEHHLAQALSDAPLAVQTTSGEVWRPRNFDGQFAGQILMIDALVRSRNVATVRLGLALGLPSVAATLNRYGENIAAPIHPSLLLGAHEMTPYQVARLYTALMSGRQRPLQAIQSVRWQDGQHVPAVKQERGDARASAWLLNYALQQVVERGTASALRGSLGAAGQGLAGKTGSSNDLRDSWFVGLGQRYVTVVWLGRDDNSPAGLSGARGAVPIYASLYHALGESGYDNGIAADVVWHFVDEQGRKAHERCADRQLPFARDSIPADSTTCKPKRRWWPFN